MSGPLHGGWGQEGEAVHSASDHSGYMGASSDPTPGGVDLPAGYGSPAAPVTSPPIGVADFARSGSATPYGAIPEQN